MLLLLWVISLRLVLKILMHYQRLRAKQLHSLSWVFLLTPYLWKQVSPLKENSHCWKNCHHIRLTAEACLDMHWQLDFLSHWPGKTLILESHWTPSTRMQLFTDASRTIGWGTYWCGRWLQGKWSKVQLHMGISWKLELCMLRALFTLAF